ncbi:unknown; predicted coding region [Mycoplasmopsis pulmonis]|uniref:Uncharacterized protein n=1 Tax=Mycoplasmopsis pulmonis (strain UAB CTIP) TaxID=272635 RepID=Q98R13_MYCPU|nr:ABC transporter permease [Mycoplasmopsis pulmonis]MDZ7293163.1 ABC transporter permease [Mycoplasmopsis pulmonis]CAC13370.1 unknown; predicted coding region [Mycoplasmopsis pulmonis]
MTKSFLKKYTPKNQALKMSTSYIQLLLKIIIRKKSSIILPVLLVAINVVLAILIGIFVSTNIHATIAIFALVFVQLLLTIIFSSIKAINIFNDMESEGIEIISFSKKITRRNIIWSKITLFILINLFWSLLIFLMNLIIFIITYNKLDLINNFLIYSFFSPLFCGLIFGFITSLISYKFSPKLALAIPILIFTPLVIGGNFINGSSSSVPKKISKILNLPYKHYDGGTILNAEKFYLNNQKDELFIIPKNIDQNTLDQRQKDFINEAFVSTKKSANLYQNFSWLSLPYQLLNIFNKNDKDVIENIFENDKSDLEKYPYYNHLDSKDFRYVLQDSKGLLKVDAFENGIEYQGYIVPGFLKNRSLIPNQINKDLIYAREGANNFNVAFQEDDFTFSKPDNLVGKIDSNIILEALKSKIFQAQAKEFFNSLDEQITKADLLSQISKALDENGLNFTNLIDESTTLFSSEIDLQKIKNLTEKKVLIGVSLIYYLYFNYQNSPLLKTLLENDNPNLKYTPQQIQLLINNEKYNIGGYSSFVQVQQAVNNKIIFRYNLEKSNNYLFQTVDQFYSLKQDSKVINKNYFPLIWISLTLLLVALNFALYIRKDFK